jgi:hypothetical protein
VSNLLVILQTIPHSGVVSHLSKLLERLGSTLSDVIIRSTPAYLIAELPRKREVLWRKGSHTANVFAGKDKFAHDVFTFSWEKNRASMLDFTSALETWMNDNV